MSVGDQRQPWEGQYRCTGRTKAGLPCSNYEIDGLGACFYHVPDELLEEAEEITGWTACRWEGGCRFIAVTGTEPPRCKNHGAPAGSAASMSAGERIVEGRILSELAEIMNMGGERLLNPRKIGDPFTELLSLAARMKELEMMATEVVAAMKPGMWRYRTAEGDAIRAEILMLERAQVRLHNVLVNLIKLKIEDRLAGVEERTLDIIERAMDMAITAGVRTAIEHNGDELEGRQEARKVLRRELPVVAASA